MTYRVYLRWPNQKVSDKTVTESRELADMSYQLLVARKDLIGKPVGVAFTHNRSGTKPEQIAFHNFETGSAQPNSDAPVKAGPTITLKKR